MTSPLTLCLRTNESIRMQFMDEKDADSADQESYMSVYYDSEQFVSLPPLDEEDADSALKRLIL